MRRARIRLHPFRRHPAKCPITDPHLPRNTHPIVEPAALAAFGKPVNHNEDAIVTGLYTDAFASAVATLGHTLNTAANTSAARLLFFLPDKVSPRALCIARTSGWEPVPIARIAPPFRGVHRHFLDQYSKLTLWALDRRGVRTAVYLDADTLVRRPLDELFRLPFAFAAVPDVYARAPGYALDFNAGVLVLRPNSTVFADMVARIASARYPALEAEQAFLNVYFGAEAARLPYAYNANLAIRERTPALWAALQREARVVHFTKIKPFLQGDYAEVPLAELERNAERVARRKPLWKDDAREWIEAWRATKEAYGAEFEKCEGLSRVPGIPVPEGMELGA